jgi:hypothetical protein
MNITKATDKDFFKFYGVRVTTAWEGLVAKEGDLITGIGGVMVLADATLWGFMDLSKQSRTPMLFRYVITFLRELKARGVGNVQVTCSEHIPRAVEFLEKLGFTRDNGGDTWTANLEVTK